MRSKVVRSSASAFQHAKARNPEAPGAEACSLLIAKDFQSPWGRPQALQHVNFLEEIKVRRIITHKPLLCNAVQSIKVLGKSLRIVFGRGG